MKIALTQIQINLILRNLTNITLKGFEARSYVDLLDKLEKNTLNNETQIETLEEETQPKETIIEKETQIETLEEDIQPNETNEFIENKVILTNNNDNSASLNKQQETNELSNGGQQTFQDDNIPINNYVEPPKGGQQTFQDDNIPINNYVETPKVEEVQKDEALNNNHVQSSDVEQDDRIFEVIDNRSIRSDEYL